MRTADRESEEQAASLERRKPIEGRSHLTVRKLRALTWRGIKAAQSSPAGPILRRAFGRATPEDVARLLYSAPTALADVTLDSNDPDVATRAAGILKEHGVVVLKGVLSSDLARQALVEADAIVAEIEGLDRAVTHGSLGKADWQTDLAVHRNYRELIEHPRPVINIRSRNDNEPDGGMIDIFKVDEMLDIEQPALRKIVDLISAGAVADIMSKATAWPRRQFNLYRNDSVTNTRILHVDNLRETMKVFVYLSDVRSPDDGPYTFMPGTHRRADLLRKMLYVNSLRGTLVTNMPTTVGRPLQFLGEAGTIIISNQTGVHGGHPQKPGASRTVLVGSYH